MHFSKYLSTCAAAAVLLSGHPRPAVAKVVGGPPSFSQPVDYDAELTGSQYVAVGDVLHRGIDDLVVTHANDGFGHVSLLLGNGRGQFGSPQRVFSGTLDDLLLKAVPADVNGDGNLDLVIQTMSNGGQQFITVALGDGNGHFKKASQTPTFSGPFVVGMFAPDKLPDVFVQAAFAVPSMLLRSDGKGGFSTSELPYGGGAGGLVAVDANHDGRLDLIGIGQSPMRFFLEQLQTLFGTGDSIGFAPPVYTAPSLLESQITGTNSGITAAVGDLRGTGDEDLLVFGADFQWGIDVAASVYLGHRDGRFDPPLLLPVVGVQAFGNSAATADLNGDGIADIAMTTSNAGSPTETYVLRGVGDGTFPLELQTTLPVAPLFPHLVVADLNGDGKPDVMISDQTSHRGVWVFLNTTPRNR